MKRLKKYEKRFWLLFKNVKTSRRKKLREMVKDLESRFFTAPASTRYHNSFTGGLLIHSVTVTEIALRFLREVRPDGISESEKESFTLVGLFHDLGKIGSIDKDLYLESETWQKERGQNYTYNVNLGNLQHQVRSLYLLQKYKIPLTEDEYHSILFHEGAFTSWGKDIRYKFSEMCWLIHSADVYSAFFLEKR